LATGASAKPEPIMKLEEATATWLADLERRNYATRTVRDYGYNLNHLARFLLEHGIGDMQAISAITLSDFQHWLFHQPTKRGAARGVVDQNMILTTIKGLFKFLKIERVLAHDPAQGLEYARQPRRLPRNVLTPREARRVIEGVDTTTARGYRDRVILEVLYATGIRRAELMNLAVEDVNLEEGLLRVNRGKGNRDRVAPLGAVASRFLETYLKGVRPQLLHGQTTEKLFLSWRGRALDRTSLSELVRRHAKRAGVRKHVTPHVWRHTCATHLVANRANLRHVQELLGHQSLATTERYLHLTIADLKEAHSKCHPRERDDRHA